MRIINLIIIGLLLLAGCGVKGDLQPKGTSEPSGPSSLDLRQQGDMIQLRWDIPTSSQDGSRLKDLAGFRINLYTYLPDQYCGECKDQETVATISAGQPDPAIIADGNIYLRLPHPGPGQGARYRVYPFTDSGKSGPFAEARQVIGHPPMAPVDIKINAIDRGANLLWTLPEGVQDYGDLLGINIYRGESVNNLNPEPINPQPVKGNNFDDFGLENDKNYHYGLRTVVKIEKTVVESGMSDIVEATPKTGL